jgi:FAD/FMN-containing dehydrogenase
MNVEHRVDGGRALIQRGTMQIGLCVCCSSLLLATLATAPGRGYPVKVYFSKHPASDENPTAVFPVRRLSPTRAVATFAIGQLLVGPTRAEARSGYYTALAGIFHGPSTCGRAAFRIMLNTRGKIVEHGTATLQFCRRTMIGGVGTAGRISSEISRTLTQFPSIKRVVILDYRGDCFSDLSGRNLCLCHDTV